MGYVIVSFGWSVEFGGLEGMIDEFYVREAVRGRGMGSEAMRALTAALSDAGLRALHLEVGEDNAKAQRFYSRLGFGLREGYRLMSWTVPQG